MAIVSTVPAAIETLAVYMRSVASQFQALNVGVYPYGEPVASVSNNLIALGNFETGVLSTPVKSAWAAIPGVAKLRSEEYELEGIIRTASGAGGAGAAQARMQEAFELSGALEEQIVTDLGANAYQTAALSPSGSWGDFTVTPVFSGPAQQSGWIVVLAFSLQVINVQLQG